MVSLILAIRTKMSDNQRMNGSELLKRLKKLARERGVICETEKRHGKGSHATLYFGSRRTTIKHRKKEIGKGLLNSMLKDPGIDKDEI